jgi:hypothetical protein
MQFQPTRDSCFATFSFTIMCTTSAWWKEVVAVQVGDISQSDLIISHDLI